MVPANRGGERKGKGKKGKNLKPVNPKKIGENTKETLFSQVKIGDIFLWKEDKRKKPLNDEAFVKFGVHSYLDGQCCIYIKKDEVTNPVIVNNVSK